MLGAPWCEEGEATDLARRDRWPFACRPIAWCYDGVQVEHRNLSNGWWIQGGVCLCPEHGNQAPRR
jgi:hypothetical protein